MTNEDRWLLIDDARMFMLAAGDILGSEKHEESWRLNHANGLAEQAIENIRKVRCEDMRKMLDIRKENDHRR